MRPSPYRSETASASSPANAQPQTGPPGTSPKGRAVPRNQRATVARCSSVAGLRGSPGAFAYGATKWALRGMTKSAAAELASRKIRVNSVHPGPIDTDMLKVRTPEQNAARVKQIPLKRMGTADEVAQVVLFLLSDESSYITGAEIAIDGAVSA